MKESCKKLKQTILEELYTTDDMSLRKRAIADLTNNQDYKTFNALLRLNPKANSSILVQ